MIEQQEIADEELRVRHEQEMLCDDLLGPGELLQKGRLALDLSEAQIAAQLRLSRSVIRALENDDYEKLPGMTFVRGYLRAYARLVGIPGDEVIVRFDAQGIIEPEKVLPATMINKQTTSKDLPIRWATYIIAVALVFLVFLWWNGHTNSASSNSEAVISLNQQIIKEELANNTEVNSEQKSLSENEVAPAANDQPQYLELAETDAKVTRGVRRRHVFAAVSKKLTKSSYI